MFGRRMQCVLMVVALLLSVFVVAGCGKKASGEKAAETTMEGMFERATGEKTDIDVNGENVTITTADGTTEMSNTNEWPADMFPEVPRFTYGVVENVTKGDEGGMKKFNVFLKEVEDGAFEKYDADIRAAGWGAQSTTQTNEGGMISAEKGNMALQLMYDSRDRTAIVIAYTVPE